MGPGGGPESPPYPPLGNRSLSIAAPWRLSQPTAPIAVGQVSHLLTCAHAARSVLRAKGDLPDRADLHVALRDRRMNQLAAFAPEIGCSGRRHPGQLPGEVLALFPDAKARLPEQHGLLLLP